jgi:O-antigen ligase
LVLTNGLVFWVANRVLDNGQSWEEPFTRAVFMAVAVAAGLAVVLDRHRIGGERLMTPAPAAAAAIVAFTGWLVASSLWSLSPDITRGRALIYVGLAAFAWIIADLEFPDFRRALALAMGVAVGASLVAVVVSDSIGLDRNDDWRGIFTSRNSLAPVAGVAIIAGASLAAEARGRRRLAAAVLPLLGVVAMLGSGSRTAWLAVFVAGGGAGIVVGARVAARRGLRVHYPALALGAGGAAATVGVVAAMWGETTFSQRRTIWSLVWDRIGERPLHGYGWFNVWSDADFTAGNFLLARGSAHGSFLEVWLGLGLIGLIPFLVIVGLALRGTITAAWRRPSVETWTWLALVLFLVIENLTESFVLWFSYNWVLLMAAALRSGGERRQPRGWSRLAATESANV